MSFVYRYADMTSFLILSGLGLGLSLSSMSVVDLDGSSDYLLNNDNLMIAGLALMGVALFQSLRNPTSRVHHLFILVMTTIGIASLGMMYFGQQQQNIPAFHNQVRSNLRISWLQCITSIIILGFILIFLQMFYPQKLAKMLIGVALLALVIVTSIFASGIENLYDKLKNGSESFTMNNDKLETTRNLSWATIALAYVVFAYGLVLF